MTEVGDMELLRDYDRQRSEAAFATLVQRHINLVYSTAFRHVGIAAHAEEITQVVFVILARQAATLRPDTILEGWLHQTTRLTALRFGRGERRRQFREQEAYMQSTLPESTDEAAAWNQLAPLLDEAISRLGKKDRDALMLRFFKDQSLREVAAALNVNEEAAQKRVRRAVEKLRRFFTRGGVVLPAAALMAAISANSVQAAPVALAQTVTTVAFAKGAAASGSTLTLIHGVLKIMAWAKLKTAIIAGAFILLSIGAGVVAVEAVDGARAASAPDIQGAWEGVCSIGVVAGVHKEERAHTRIVLKIYKTNGVYSAIADGIDLEIKDVRPVRVVYNFPAIRIDMGWTVFEATLNNDGTKMTFPGAPPVVMERTDTPDTVPERFSASDYAPRAGSDLQGCWKGDFNEGRPVYWKIAEPTNGIFRGEVDNPMIGETHKPFSVIYHRPSVTLTVLYGTGIFQGELNGAGTEITGTWLQLGKEKPITLTRTDYQPESARPESEYKFVSKTDLQGHWKTDLDLRVARQILDMGDMKTFPADLDIARLPDGAFSAAVTLPSAAYIGLGDPIPASAVQYQPPNLRLEWKTVNAVFAAQLVNGKLTGNFRLGDSSIPLTFERRH